MNIGPVIIITSLALSMLALFLTRKRRKNPTAKECRLCCEPVANTSGYCSVHFEIEAGKLAASHARILKRDNLLGGDDE